MFHLSFKSTSIRISVVRNVFRKNNLLSLRGGATSTAQQPLRSSSSNTLNNFTQKNDENEISKHNEIHIDPSVARLIKSYPGKFLSITIPHYPNCDIYLCGTLHVAKSSIDMVQDVIRTLRPEYVVLELCEGRIEGLIPPPSTPTPSEEPPITFQDILRNTWKEKSLRTLGMGLLSWMQIKASHLTGSQLGGELAVACQEAHQLQPSTTVILGDRFFAVTIQRLFDGMTMIQKMKMCGCIVWEAVTMSFHNLQDYLHQTQENVDFVQTEIERFAQSFPEVAEVIIQERDEYMSYILGDLAAHTSSSLTGSKSAAESKKNTKIVAIVGAGHLVGIQRLLSTGKVISVARMREIATSSKHACTWDGPGYLPVVDTNKLYHSIRSSSSSSCSPSTSSPSVARSKPYEFNE